MCNRILYTFLSEAWFNKMFNTTLKCKGCTERGIQPMICSHYWLLLSECEGSCTIKSITKHISQRISYSRYESPCALSTVWVLLCKVDWSFWVMRSFQARALYSSVKFERNVDNKGDRTSSESVFRERGGQLAITAEVEGCFWHQSLQNDLSKSLMSSDAFSVLLPESCSIVCTSG